MASITRSEAHRDTATFARIVNEESNRLCLMIDNSSDREARDLALRELKELASTVRIVVAAFGLDSDQFDETELTTFEVAA